MGTGNTVCFWSGVIWGMGMVLTFCTCEHTVPLPGGTGVLPPYLHDVGGVTDNCVGVVKCHPCK